VAVALPVPVSPPTQSDADSGVTRCPATCRPSGWRRRSASPPTWASHPVAERVRGPGVDLLEAYVSDRVRRTRRTVSDSCTTVQAALRGTARLRWEWVHGCIRMVVSCSVSGRHRRSSSATAMGRLSIGQLLQRGQPESGAVRGRVSYGRCRRVSPSSTTTASSVNSATTPSALARHSELRARCCRRHDGAMIAYTWKGVHALAR
jgi:hypothetical protein